MKICVIHFSFFTAFERALKICSLVNGNRAWYIQGKTIAQKLFPSELQTWVCPGMGTCLLIDEDDM